MDILCLMGLFPDEYREEIEKCSTYGMQNAANKLQWAIVRGLDQIEGVNVKIANSLYIGSYPKRYKTCKIPTFEFHHTPDSKDINIGFCNLTGWKWISRYHSTKKVVKEWAKSEGDKEKVLLIYALTTPFANIAEYVKRKYKHIKVCIVVPDLPDYMYTGSSSGRKKFYRFAKNVEIKIIRKCIRNVDCYVLLTDAMKEWFKTPITYTVVEGISVDAEKSTEEDLAQKKKRILYAGGIKEEYGVVDLARAFAKINDPLWELEIYGDGPGVAAIKELSKDCPGIKAMGRAANAVVVAAQKDSSLLVNPRKNQIFTKYSFPSKILEYMSSGTPMMGYMLDGMPPEYKGNFFAIEESDDGLEKTLRAVMSMRDEERVAMGKKAKAFVLEHKTPKKQCTKIIKMLQSL